MARFFKKMITILTENITTIVTIVGGIWLFFTHQKYTTNELLAYIVSMLTLIASSLLIEKLVRLSSIEKKVEEIKTRLAFSDRLLFGHELNLWKDAIGSANSLFISGGSLHFLLGGKSGNFEELLKCGCRIEIVPVRPFTEASKNLYNNVVREVPTVEEFDRNIVQTLRFLIKYKKMYPKQVIIRLEDQIPALGIVAIYRNFQPTNLQITLLSGKVPYDKRLIIRVDDSPAKDRYVFEYFNEQIESLRERLSECTIEQIERICSPDCLLAPADF